MSLTLHNCVIAISPSGDAILVASEPCLIDCQFFDGCDLRDNITSEDTIPTKAGVYKCCINVEYSPHYDHRSGETEYESEAWIEDAIPIAIEI